MIFINRSALNLSILNLAVLCLSVFPACRKYLDKVPDSSLTVPRTMQDLQALLDNDLVTKRSTPGLGQLATDDYFISYPTWEAADPVVRNVYTWQKAPYPDQAVPGWDNPYTAIYYANAVLDELGNVQPATPALNDAVKGTALFYRSFMFYELEETFGQPFNPVTAGSDSGIILRVHADPADRPGRSSVRAVYDQITSDLLPAVALLPANPDPVNPNRPSRPAAFALLARVYLTMQDYSRAGAYADSCLRIYSNLLDYNALDTAAPRPFPMPGNEEVLFQCSTQSYPTHYATTTAVDTTLYAAYDPNDLRRILFFGTNSQTGTHYFKGQYTGLAYLFAGLAIDEIFLIRAECHARTGDEGAALADLNTLLSARWKTGTFLPYTTATAGDPLRLILQERRKETLFRDLRWPDLRRLNQDTAFAATLTRLLNGQVYTLPPGDARYAFPLPDDELQPGITK